MSSIARLAFLCGLAILPQWALAGEEFNSRCVSASIPKDLISAHTEGRFLGVLGDPGVNVLELNIALDKEAALK